LIHHWPVDGGSVFAATGKRAKEFRMVAAVPRALLAVVFLTVLSATNSPRSAGASPDPAVVAVLHTYEARIRFEGKVSTTQVRASDAGQAKKLVQQQFPKATVLSVKRVD
jgi:hypothetical protein